MEIGGVWDSSDRREERLLASICSVEGVLDVCMVYDVFFFFFQGEDGIRDLVGSRGLGDVYKRQPLARVIARLKSGGCYFCHYVLTN